MISKRVQEKGILTKLLEKGIRILLIKECKKIKNIKIDIISSSAKIIKGEIQKINIIAEDIVYNNLFFDGIELEANHLKINIKLINTEVYFTNNPILKFKISLSHSSLRTVLLTTNWNWIGNMIAREILNKEKLDDIKIINGQLLMKASDNNTIINKLEQINITTEKGKIYLKNKTKNKSIKLPIEDKIFIENINIENNYINIFANSPISF